MLVLDEPAEQALALLLTRYGEVVDEVADHLAAAQAVRLPLRPGRGPVGLLRAVPGAEVEGEVRDSRLALCMATKRVLASGLNLLGIEALDRM